MGEDAVVESNMQAFKREEEAAFTVLQRNRHSSVAPFKWFGPEPEPETKAGEGCICGGCEARERFKQAIFRTSRQIEDL